MPGPDGEAPVRSVRIGALRLPPAPRARIQGSWYRLLPPLVAAGAAIVILSVLNPHLLVTATTPSGGDMGAHVLGPALLRDVLLPQGRVLGWSNSWFAGFPAFYFYFPLPSLVVVLLDVFLPYGVAFKIVTVLGLVALPPAVLFLARSFRYPRSVAAVTAAGATAFVLMESYAIYGGNVASVLAGEFSYSWSFSLGLIYLGLLVRAVRDDRRYLPWAVTALAATVLSHVLTSLVLVLASIALLTWKRAVKTVVFVFAWAFAITAFWSVPLLARIGLTSDMGWTPLRRLEEVLPFELWLLLPFAIGGVVFSIRRYPRSLPLAVAMLLPVVYYPLPLVLPAVVDSLADERWKLWNARLLPYWYFGVAFFSAVALGAVVAAASRRLPDRASIWWARGLAVVAGVAAGWLLVDRGAPTWVGWVLAGAGAAVAMASFAFRSPVSATGLLVVSMSATLVLGAVAGTSYLAGWSNWNYSGYEAKEAWPEYRDLMATMDSLPPGRVLWEQDSSPGTGLDRYGTPMAPMLYPYWTNWSHPSMEGLYFESALTTPFMFLAANEMSLKGSAPVGGLDYHPFDFDRGLPHLQQLGVRYYVSYSTEAAARADSTVGLDKRAQTGPFGIYELSEVSLVEPLVVQPSAFAPSAGEGEPEDFQAFALRWFGTMDALDHVVVDEAVDGWPEVGRVEELIDRPTGIAAAAVSQVTVTDDEVSFTTAAVGIPHIVKVSYFPNWSAEGADGPYRATPSFMVVVPREEQVVMRFRNTWAENLGNALSVMGGSGLVFYAWWRRRHRKLTEMERRAIDGSQRVP